MPRSEFGKSRDIIGKVFNVGGRYISYAKKIKRKSPELAQMVRDGKITLIEAMNKIKKGEQAPESVSDEYMDSVKKVLGKNGEFIDAFHGLAASDKVRKINRKESSQLNSRSCNSDQHQRR